MLCEDPEGGEEHIMEDDNSQATLVVLKICGSVRGVGLPRKHQLQPPN